MRLPVLLRVIPLLCVAAMGTSCTRSGAVPSLSPDEAAERVRAGTAVLVDVREAAEWRDTGVVASAHLLGLSDLRGPRTQWTPFLQAHKDRELILYCRTGNRSGQAARILAAEGYQVANGGGLRAWIDAGQPIRRAEEPPVSPAPAPAPTAP